jgi:hypothetical protein
MLKIKFAFFNVQFGTKKLKNDEYSNTELIFEAFCHELHLLM